MKFHILVLAMMSFFSTQLLADNCKKSERPTGCLAPDPVCVVAYDSKSPTENCHLTYEQSFKGKKGLKMCNNFSWESCCVNLCVDKVNPNKKSIPRDRPSVTDVPKSKLSAFQSCLAECSYVTPGL